MNIIRAIRSCSITAFLIVISSLTLFAQVPIGGAISDGVGGPLLSGTVYHTTSSLNVPAGMTLTIQAGAIVKFGVGHNLDVDGTLICGGAGQQTFLTALTDDAAGGDTDSSPTLPSPGFWRTIRFEATSVGSTVTNTVIRYGGRFGSATVAITDSSPQFSTCNLSDGSAAGVTMSAVSMPMFSNCTFDDFSGAAMSGVSVAILPNFSNNTSNNNGTNGILLQAGAIGASVVVNADSVMGGGHILSGSTSIPVGLTMTVGAGVVIKIAGSATIDVAGTLLTNGTSGNAVVFTGISDDSIGGDTNGNGVSNGVPGDWSRIVFRATSDASSLNNTLIRFGGRFGNDSIDLEASDLSMTSCTIENGLNAAISLNAGNAAGNSLPTISGCAFNNNGSSIDQASIEAISGFSNNTATGNSARNVIEKTLIATVDSATVAVDNLIEDTLFCASSTTVSAGHTLTIGPNVVLKNAVATQYQIDGTLLCQGTAGAEVVFTVLRDDSVGGDQDLNGPTVGAPGDWIALRFAATSGASVLANTRVRFAGRFGINAVTLTAADITMTGCTVESSATAGLTMDDSSRPTISNCALNDNVRSTGSVPWEALPGMTNNTAMGNTSRNVMAISGAPIANSIAVGTDNLIAGALQTSASFTVNALTTLTLTAGVVVKFSVAHNANIIGVLNAAGTASNPVVFTSFTDDSAGGDSNLDGATTVPSTGFWGGINLNADSDASVLDNVEIRYGGRFNLPMLRLTESDITFSNGKLEFAQAEALELSNNSLPTVVAVEFNNNQRLVDGLHLKAIEGFRRITASGNTTGDTFVISSLSLTTIAKLFHFNYPNDSVRLQSSLIVDVNGGLEIGAGVIVKVPISGAILVNNGVLVVKGTGYRPVVFTSINDDSLGGDANNNGLTTGSSGDWNGVTLGTTSLGSRLDHLSIRYAGRFNASGLSAISGNDRLRQVRVEDCQANGFSVSNLIDGLWNCVAVNNGSDGFELNSGTFDLVHCTAANNGGFGIDRAVAHSGEIHNSICWDNSSGDLDSVVVGEIFNSDTGDVSLAGFNDNISMDPLFVDAANGDFNLQDGSPAINGGSFVRSTQVILDHIERSRALDHDFSGQVLGDMGAYEKAGYVLDVVGIEKIGGVMGFTVAGALPGIATLAFGFLDGLEFCPGHGFLTIGLADTITIIGMMPANSSFLVGLPITPALEGFEFGVQGAAFPASSPSTGNLTERYRARFFN